MNSTGHQRSELAAYEASAASVSDVESFKEWMRTDVRRVLPHGFCACVHGRIYGVGVSPDYVIAVDYPVAHLAAIRNASGHMDTPLAERWYKTRRPVLFDVRHPWPELTPGWLASFDAHDHRNAAANGVLDTESCIATYFSFHQLPDIGAPYLQATLESLTPLLHSTLKKVIVRVNLEGEADARSSQLSTREREILTHIARGKSNIEIAQLLGVSDYTVRNHVSRMLEKTKCTNRTGLARLAKTRETGGIGTKVL